jgi:hypothetical protein
MNDKKVELVTTSTLQTDSFRQIRTSGGVYAFSIS